MDDGCVAVATDRGGSCQSGESDSGLTFTKDCGSPSELNLAPESLVSNGLSFSTSSLTSNSACVSTSVVDALDSTSHEDTGLETFLQNNVATDCSAAEETGSLKVVPATDDSSVEPAPLQGHDAPTPYDTGQSHLRVQQLSGKCFSVSNEVCETGVCDDADVASNGPKSEALVVASVESSAVGDHLTPPPLSEGAAASDGSSGEKVTSSDCEHTSHSTMGYASHGDNDSGLSPICSNTVVDVATTEVAEPCLPPGDKLDATATVSEVPTAEKLFETDVPLCPVSKEQAFNVGEDSNVADVDAVDSSTPRTERCLEPSYSQGLLDEVVGSTSAAETDQSEEAADKSSVLVTDQSVEIVSQSNRRHDAPGTPFGAMVCASADESKMHTVVSSSPESGKMAASAGEEGDEQQGPGAEVAIVSDCVQVDRHSGEDLTLTDTESCKCVTDECEVLYDVPPREDETTTTLEVTVPEPSDDIPKVDVGVELEPASGDALQRSPEEPVTSAETGDTNFYEEIKRDLGNGANPEVGGQETNELLFKRVGLVDEVLTEVERVQQRHAQVLQELNLDIENLIMPATPSVSPLTDGETLLQQPPPPQQQQQPPLPPPSVPPHHLTVAAAVAPPAPETKSHNLCTRTLPPLPVESPQEPVPLRSAPVSRELQQTKSAPATYQVPTSSPAATPTGVKHWLSRLSSFPSFREKKPRSSYSDAGLNWRWSVGGTAEPIYMLYDDSYHLHEGQRCEPEDGIYEDIDRHSQRYTMPSTGGYCPLPKANLIVVDGRSLSSSENNDDNSDCESVRSSGSLSVSSLKGKLINFGRKISRQEEKAKDVKSKNLESNGKPEGKFTRLFSKRKGYDLSRIQGGGLIVEQPEENKLPQLKMSNLHQRPILPPPPSGLSPEQTKRRYIVGTLVHSENSYVASLKRLVHEYKKPLEDTSPPILSANKIAVLFHRLPEILQCHTNFCVSLAVCVHQWDVEEKIGDVFLHAFSKTSVLDVYSDYINNFSLAMESAKLEAKRKSAFTDFLKMKQITSHDRLSFFGLMVKPVQRFPQFILLLQDLLRHTPQRHHDRMALQLALTQMETMADMLNERKRESDQAHAVKDILRHVSAKSAARSLSEGMRYLLRQDTLTQLIFNQNGQWMKSKDRKLFLLNDLLVCVSVGPSNAENNSRKSERLSFKWLVPITEVEVQEDASPILNRMVYAMSAGQSSATKPDTPNGPEEMEGMKSIYQDLNDLLHDFEVTSRISALVSTLKKSYMEISVELMQSLSQSIQQAIQKKDEEVKWIDSCCLQFSVPLKTKTGKVHRELMIFQSKSMDTKQEWLTDVRLAQLARDVNNSPAWDIPEQERRPSTKIPLFVKAVSVHSSRDPTEVKCGCYHRTMSNRILGRRPQDYVWLCSTDGVNSHISVHTLRQMGLRDVFSFDLAECRISAMETVPSVECPSPEIGLHGDTVWMGTESRRILVFSGSDIDHYQEVGCVVMSASVLHLKYHLNQVFVALANGTVAVFRRNSRGYWLIKDFQVITLGSDPVTCLLPVNASIYCGCGRKVWVVDSSTAKVTHNHSVQHDHMGSIYTMAHSGIGLWLNLRNTAQVCLYHAETFQHLQDINITSSVRRVLDQNRLRTPHYIYITTLTASWGLLWIGTNAGVILSIPLPRLQGMPILGRRANMAYHANVGPVSTILVLQLPPPTSASPLSNEIKKPTKGDDHQIVTDGSQVGASKPVVTVPLYSQHFRSRLSLRGDSLSNLGMAKTLPRSWKSNMVHDDPQYSIFGLYDNLLNVREGVEDPVGVIEEDLRHSNPDLIPSLVNTLDRRLRLNSGRPRSLDLANLPLVNDIVCVSSSSEDCGSGSQSLAELPELGFLGQAQIRECELEDPESRNVEPSRCVEIDLQASGVSTVPDHRMLNISTVTLPKKGPVANPQAIQRSVVTLVGGRGYVDLRKMGNLKERLPSASNSSINPGDAYAILWEMKMVQPEKNRIKK